MKKLLSVVLATLMLISVFPFALPQTVTAATTERIAYLDATSGNDDEGEIGNANKAYKTFKEAYNALCPEGGTILFTAPYGYETERVSDLKTHYGEITITANGNMDNYWMMGLYQGDEFVWYSVKFGGPVIIDDICLLDIVGKQEYIFANFNRLVIGENVQCSKATMSGTTISEIAKHTAPSSNGISISGGALTLGTGTFKRDTCVTVKSGYWRAVAGGSRHESTDKITTYDGTFRVYFEGGSTNYLIGGNWGSGTHCGGQFQLYVSGGNANYFYMGHQTDKCETLRNSFLVWTGGVLGMRATNEKEIYGIVSGKTDATLTLLYGRDVSAATASLKAFDSDGDGCYQINRAVASGFVSDGVTHKVTYKKLLNVIKLPESGTPTIYVDQKKGTAYGNGSEDSPVNSLLTAYAMLYLTGGTIKLKSDYTMLNVDCGAMFSFREPDHANPIVVDGQGYTFSKEAADRAFTVTKNEKTYSSPRGFDAYILSGDTTFKNIKFDFSTEVNFCANYNALVMDEGIERVQANVGIYLLGGNLYTRELIGETYYKRDTYSSSFEPYYADWSDADTSITVKSGKFWVSAFSRMIHAGPEVHFGSGYVNIQGGEITNLYAAPTNSATAYADEVILDISGGTVGVLYCGGAKAGYGVITGSTTVNIGANTVVNTFSDVAACNDYIVNINNNDFATYVAAYNAVGSFATVTTDMTAPVIDGLTFGAKDLGDGEYAVRARFKTACEYFVGEDADLYDIVELGVLVATADNASTIKYVKGEYYYGVPEFVENPANFEGKIGKSVAYVKENDEADSYDAYEWAGEDAYDTAVYFTAPIYDIVAENFETAFVFVPYMVMVDAAGKQQVFYGDDTDAVSYSSIIANAAN